ncbi:MAG: tRNA preQ1(34) S-adenosylmethionine ribosyltransferase-isomerase QueA [Gemmatimonadales bacterium]|nr:MAG: tRNA preQ1(34) S-adenosylmethionine ribosyltransferase-isomerase QueA [Gemmatimonadales bacterium]
MEAWDWPLPEELVARYPARKREDARLMVLRPDGGPEHGQIPDLPGWMSAGDLLVLNETRVLPVRLLGRKTTGARAEVLLVEPAPGGDSRSWHALVRPGRKLRPGHRVQVGDGLEVAILDRLTDGGRLVRLESALPVEEALEQWGRLPLPPYLEREEEDIDRVRYQTVYARVPGSVAAPTAGLHLTDGLLDRLREEGVRVARVTLHVGPGTFRPVEAERVEDHGMHAERWEVPPEAALAVDAARERGGRIWAVGTTVVRTLESAARGDGGRVEAGSGETRLFLRPGRKVQVVDGLLTNFHLPRSTLLMLVATFAGYHRTRAAYREAVETGYRFYSYGDAMLVPPDVVRAGAPGGSAGDRNDASPVV